MKHREELWQRHSPLLTSELRHSVQFQPQGILPTCLCKHINQHSHQLTRHYVGYWEILKTLLIFTSAIILRAKA